MSSAWPPAGSPGIKPGEPVDPPLTPGRYGHVSRLDPKAAREELVAKLEAANAAKMAARRELKALQDSERTEVLKLQAELASARQELEQLRREPSDDRSGFDLAVAASIDRLVRELAAADTTVTALRTILRSDPNPPGRVIESHERWMCETCGTRYGVDYPDHTCGRLTPVTITISRRSP